MTALVGSLSLAGGGYLIGREGIAACGAVVGAFGLAVERFAGRTLRRRARQQRLEHRIELRAMQRDLDQLRRDLDTALARFAAPTALAEIAAARTAAMTEVVESESLAGTRDRDLDRDLDLDLDLDGAEVTVELPTPTSVWRNPVPAPVSPAPPAELLRDEEPVPAPAAAIPGQQPSPLATGGIPVLRPGPAMPLPAVPAAASTGSRGPATGELPSSLLSVEALDQAVYSALAETELDELTSLLEIPGRVRPGGPATGELIVVSRVTTAA